MNMTSESTPGSTVPEDDDFLANINVKIFSYNELATATNGFNNQSILGEGSSGPVFKAELESSGQLVAVKVLNPDGLQGDKEFMMKVQILSRLHHPNIINLIGCCIEDPHRILVYEFMHLGSLQNHLHDFGLSTPEMEPLDWNTRMMIADGVAKALDYLHNEAQPPVIYRDLKSDNILLDKGFHPKISGFGIAMFVPDIKSRIFTDTLMGNCAYSVPEFSDAGEVTTKSDVYSFGVVLLELFTGLRALDVHRENEKYYLADWVHYKMTNYREDIVRLADPRLNGEFPKRIFGKVISLGLRCTEDDPEWRPSMKDVVKYLKSSMEVESRGSSNSTVSELVLTETKLGKSVWGRRRGQLVSSFNKNPYEKQGQSEL